MIAPEPFFEPRGTPISVLNRSKALAEIGNRIDILTYHIGHSIYIKNVVIKRIPKIKFIKNIAVGPSRLKILLDVILFFESLNLLLKKKYDCIHAHEEAVFIGYILKKIFSIPLIYDMHSRIPEQLEIFNFIRNKLLIKLAYLIEMQALKNSDIIIAICTYLEESVHRIVPNKKVITIENMPQIFSKKTTRKEIYKIKKRLGIRSEKIIMYAGTFAPYQGIDLLLNSIPQVLTEFKNVKFIFIGGNQKEINRAKSISDSLNISDKTIFIGKQPIDTIPSFFDITDVLASPRIEGRNVPLKIYSYLMSGKPIVATNIIAHTQVLNEHTAILVNPKSRDFGNGISKILKDKRLCGKIGAAGKKFIESKYSYDDFLLKTKEVCDYIGKIIQG